MTQIICFKIKDKAGAKSKYCSIDAVRGTKIPFSDMQSFNQSSNRCVTVDYGDRRRRDFLGLSGLKYSIVKSVSIVGFDSGSHIAFKTHHLIPNVYTAL